MWGVFAIERPRAVLQAMVGLKFRDKEPEPELEYHDQCVRRLRATCGEGKGPGAVYGEVAVDPRDEGL